MIEKVTLQLNKQSQFKSEDGIRCENRNPKALLLYAGAKCAALTALHIMKKEQVCPKRFEITLAGELSIEEQLPDPIFTSFHVVYNIECATERDQVKVSRAITLTHDRHCGMLRMLRKIAPMSREIAIVSTELAEV